MARRLGQVAQKAGIALALLVPASAVTALAFHAYRAAEVPSRSDWEKAAATVRGAYRDGDIIAFLPGWAQEGRGLFAGLRAIPQERWGEDEVASASRVILVLSFGAAIPAWLRESTEIEYEEAAGRIRIVRLRRLGQGKPVTDFIDKLGTATVGLDLPDRSLVCGRQGDRFDCTQGQFPWRMVGEGKMGIGGKLRRCITAHPTTGATLRITFGPSALGARLRVSHGISDAVAAGGTPVTMDILIGSGGGESAARIPHPAGVGWRRSYVDTARWRGRLEPVTFQITTPNDGARHFCFAAEAIE
jgi:hypothetical protein